MPTEKLDKGVQSTGAHDEGSRTYATPVSRNPTVLKRMGCETSIVVERLFPQINRVLKINQLETITDDVIEAAASILVIGN